MFFALVWLCCRDVTVFLDLRGWVEYYHNWKKWWPKEQKQDPSWNKSQSFYQGSNFILPANLNLWYLGCIVDILILLVSNVKRVHPLARMNVLCEFCWGLWISTANVKEIQPVWDTLSQTCCQERILTANGTKDVIKIITNHPLGVLNIHSKSDGNLASSWRSYVALDQSIEQKNIGQNYNVRSRWPKNHVLFYKSIQSFGIFVL